MERKGNTVAIFTTHFQNVHYKILALSLQPFTFRVGLQKTLQ
jgi:hypothetical protein